jgi:glycosyltransferase involved in cell wall biosynthesis
VQPRRRLVSTADGVDVLQLAVPGRPDPFRVALEGSVARELALTIASGLAATPLCVLVQLPFWGPVGLELSRLLAVPLVYDRLDLHRGFPGVPPDVARLEGELMAVVDVLLASSPKLFEGGALPARRQLVPNAVRAEDFARVERTFGEPVTVGYVGALASWFDTAGVVALAESRPDWRIRLAGRLETPEVRWLERRPNVELLGEIPYSDVPGFLAGLRALIIPFLDLPLTRAVDPVKLYEGLAAGLPVVSVPLPAIARWREPLVYTFAAADELPAVLERALAEDGKELAMQRREAVRGETWEARAQQVLALLARPW